MARAAEPSTARPLGAAEVHGAVSTAYSPQIKLTTEALFMVWRSGRSMLLSGGRVWGSSGVTRKPAWLRPPVVSTPKHLPVLSLLRWNSRHSGRLGHPLAHVCLDLYTDHHRLARLRSRSELRRTPRTNQVDRASTSPNPLRRSQ